MADARMPAGVRLAAVKAGIKPSGNTDLALAVADSASSAAAAFTTNQFCAAPVIIGREHLATGTDAFRAVVVNAGNANCATGQAGLAAARLTCAALAHAIGCEASQVFPSSTGIIGVPLPVDKLVSALPAAISALGNTSGHIEAFSRAIMTTDTVPKVASCTVSISGREVRLLGFAKGAGMIHPQIQMAGTPHATMLVYVFCDIAATGHDLQMLLSACIEDSFNSISIDGDTSTNDTVLLLATGASGASLHVASAGECAAFQQALLQVCQSLAKSIVTDGEGVRHVVEIQVTGARTAAEARTVAKLLAHSPLVKTAWAGEDPNWGRLVSAIGAGPVRIDPSKLRLAYGPHPVFENGGRADAFDAAAIHAYLKQPEYVLHVALGLGDAGTRFWTTDLTVDYVKINADYST